MRADKFNDLHARALVYTVLGGLSVLANHGLCHGDLRAQNVLVFEFQPALVLQLSDSSTLPCSRDNMDVFVASLSDIFPSARMSSWVLCFLKCFLQGRKGLPSNELWDCETRVTCLYTIRKSTSRRMCLKTCHW